MSRATDDGMPTSDEFPVMRRRKVFTCPHCGELCSLPVAIQILEPQKFVQDNDDFEPLAGLSTEQRAIVALAEKNGMLEAFRQAVMRRGGNEGNAPKQIGKFFVAFLKKAAQKTVPRFVLDHYRENFYGLVEFAGSDGVLAVLSDGQIVAFLPLRLARGESIRSAVSGSQAGRLSASVDEFADWVKTRNGYVPSDCKLFLKEMHKRSVGDFADVRL